MDALKNYFIFLSVFILVSCGGGGGGGGSAAAEILSKITSFASDVLSTEVGGTATLTWSSTETTSCTASGGWSGQKATSGSEEVTISTAGNTSYSLRCTGATGSSGTSSVTIEGYRNFKGITADGYISNASIFIDENTNYTLDDSEARTTSNNGGAFGNLKYQNGVLISYGGTDLDTQISLDDLLMTHSLSGYTESKVITPITSIASFMSSPSDINSVLGIVDSIDISITDPVANKGSSGAYDYYYEKGSQLTILAYALQNISNNMNSSTDKTEDYFKAISEELEKAYAISSSRVDIEDNAFITNVVENITTAKSISISNDGKASISTALSSLLPYVQVKPTNALTTSLTRFGLSTFQNDIKSLANGSAVSGLLGTYKNDLSNYIATDQSTSISDIEPDVLIVNDLFSTAEDTPSSFNVMNNDSINPNASFTISSSSGSNGSVTVVDNVVTYSPNLNYFGDDTFSYTVVQGAKSATASVTVSVSPVDDPPALDISTEVSYNENSTDSIKVASAQDVDGEDQTLTMSGADADSFDLSSANVLTFKTPPDYETKSSYSLSFTISDGTTEVTEDVTFTIVDINEQVGFEVLKVIEVIKTVE